MPPPEACIVLGLLALSVVVFAREWIPVELTALLLIAILSAAGILDPDDAFSGFGSEVLVILASVFILGGALERNGLMDSLGFRVSRLAARGPVRFLAAIMGAAGFTSAVLNNTTTAATFVSPTIHAARHIGASPSQFLMPVAFASILGGTCTLLGTSTNIAVSSYLEANGIEPLSLFELTPVGIVLLGLGILYMITIGRHLLPSHVDRDLETEYGIRLYLSEVIVPPGSPLIGQAVIGSALTSIGAQILLVLRGGRRILPTPGLRIDEGDVFLVQARPEVLLKVKEGAGFEILPDLKLGLADLAREDIRIAEILVTPGSELIGRTLRQARMRERHGVTVLALYRHGQALRQEIREIPIHLGDLLLLQGPADRVEALRFGGSLLILGEMRPRPYRRTKGLIAAAAFAAAIGLAAFGLVPLSTGILSAALLTVLCGSLTLEEAYGSIRWGLLILIGSLMAFGKAMETSGAADFLVETVVTVLANGGPMLVLAGLMVLTIGLTQPMSNAAAALVILPVALASADYLGVAPRPFAIGILLAASISLITPLEPACLLVYGPGKYRFLDYFRTGALLTLILFAVCLVLIPIFWPLAPAGGAGP